MSSCRYAECNEAAAGLWAKITRQSEHGTGSEIGVPLTSRLHVSETAPTPEQEVALGADDVEGVHAGPAGPSENAQQDKSTADELPKVSPPQTPWQPMNDEEREAA
eukprot:scaffold134394_cov48-Prasinocladus_malaysianus.AAC.1